MSRKRRLPPEAEPGAGSAAKRPRTAAPAVGTEEGEAFLWEQFALYRQAVPDPNSREARVKAWVVGRQASKAVAAAAAGAGALTVVAPEDAVAPTWHNVRALKAAAAAAVHSCSPDCGLEHIDANAYGCPVSLEVHMCHDVCQARTYSFDRSHVICALRGEPLRDLMLRTDYGAKNEHAGGSGDVQLDDSPYGGGAGGGAAGGGHDSDGEAGGPLDRAVRINCTVVGGRPRLPPAALQSLQSPPGSAGGGKERKIQTPGSTFKNSPFLNSPDDPFVSPAGGRPDSAASGAGSAGGAGAGERPRVRTCTTDAKKLNAIATETLQRLFDPETLQRRSGAKEATMEREITQSIRNYFRNSEKSQRWPNRFLAQLICDSIAAKPQYQIVPLSPAEEREDAVERYSKYAVSLWHVLHTTPAFSDTTRNGVNSLSEFSSFVVGLSYLMRRGRHSADGSGTVIPKVAFMASYLPLEGDLESYGFLIKDVTKGYNIIMRCIESCDSTAAFEQCVRHLNNSPGGGGGGGGGAGSGPGGGAGGDAGSKRRRRLPALLPSHIKAAAAGASPPILMPAAAAPTAGAFTRQPSGMCRL